MWTYNNNSAYSVDGELYHYGRKGMKWGQHIFGEVRTGIGRVRTRMKTFSENRKKLAKENIIRSGDAKIVYKNRHKLSDAELQRAMDRIKKDQDVKNLTRSPANKFVKNGSISVAHALEKGGRTAVTTLGVGLASYAIYRGVKRAVGPRTASVLSEKGSKIASAISEDVAERVTHKKALAAAKKHRKYIKTNTVKYLKSKSLKKNIKYLKPGIAKVAK